MPLLPHGLCLELLKVASSSCMQAPIYAAPRFFVAALDIACQIKRNLIFCAQVGTPLTHRHFLRRHQGSYGPGIRAGEATFPGPTTPIPGAPFWYHVLFTIKNLEATVRPYSCQHGAFTTGL